MSAQFSLAIGMVTINAQQTRQANNMRGAMMQINTTQKHALPRKALDDDL